MNKNILFGVIMISLILISACTPGNNLNNDEDNKISAGAVITHRTWGGFTMPEHNVQELVVSDGKAVLSIKSFDGTITATESKELTAQEYEALLLAFNQNEFLSMQNLYEPGAGDPMVADTGNLEIRVDMGSKTKAVQVIPYYGDYMPEELQVLDEMLLSIKNELFEQFLKNQNAGATNLKFQPMQCEKTPWMEWYENSGILFVKEPTQEELIVMYYGGQHEIELTDVKEVQTDRMVCEACGVCPLAEYFEATVKSNNFDLMLSEGWEEI